MAVLKGLRDALTGGSLDDRIEQAEQRALALRAQRQTLQGLQAAAEVRASEAALDAVTSHNFDAVAQARNEVASLRERAEVVQSSLDIADAQLQSLRDQKSAELGRKQWADLDLALAERRKTIVAVIKHTEALAKAIEAAQEAAKQAFDLMPRKFVEAPTSNGGYHVAEPFTDLSGEVRILMSLATNGRLGPLSGSALWQEQQKPGLLERVDASAADWQQLNPHSRAA